MATRRSSSPQPSTSGMQNITFSSNISHIQDDNDDTDDEVWDRAADSLERTRALVASWDINYDMLRTSEMSIMRPSSPCGSMCSTDSSDTWKIDRIDPEEEALLNARKGSGINNKDDLGEVQEEEVVREDEVVEGENEEVEGQNEDTEEEEAVEEDSSSIELSPDSSDFDDQDGDTEDTQEAEADFDTDESSLTQGELLIIFNFSSSN